MCSKFGESVDLLILGDQVLLSRGLSVRVSRCDFRSDHILLKKVLPNELLQVLSEWPTLPS